MDIEKLRQELTRFGQDHLLAFWSQLTDDDKRKLYNDIKSIDLPKVTRIFQRTLPQDDSCPEDAALDESLLQPVPDEVHQSVTRCPDSDQYRSLGLQSIAKGEVAALLLAGGQGTRLGVNYPKGMYDVGLPSGKTLYQLQGERLLRLQHLAQQETGQECHIPWYIMTSEQTKEPTEKFFLDHNYFGLRREDIVIFEQQTMPCFTPEGKIILEKPYRVARAPDGNGGLYDALRDRDILGHMAGAGVKNVHVYCVDNILVKMCDPTFIGYCINRGADAGAKVVEKSAPQEAVGIICRVKGDFQVVEYSEITQNIAQARNPDGRLTFNAGSICNHFFTLNFLNYVSKGKELKHHVAHKKITTIDDRGDILVPQSPNGIKLEKFVFDVFCFTKEEEFSPLKNSASAPKDTPITARNSLYQLHKALLVKAGGIITPSQDEVEVVEISPLVSYDGEGLDMLVSGKTFTLPITIHEPVPVVTPLSDMETKVMQSEATNPMMSPGVAL